MKERGGGEEEEEQGKKKVGRWRVAGAAVWLANIGGGA